MVGNLGWVWGFEGGEAPAEGMRGFWEEGEESRLLSETSGKSITTISPDSTGSDESNSSAKSTKLLHVALPPESLQLVPSMLTLPVTVKTSSGFVLPMPTLAEFSQVLYITNE